MAGWAVARGCVIGRGRPGDRAGWPWDRWGMRPLADRLLPDALWQRIQPLLPPPPGGGAPRTVPDRACMAAIVFMCRTSTPWALLPVTALGCGSVRPPPGGPAGRPGRRGAAGLVAGQRRLGEPARRQGGT